jgi:hypothetical protein
MSETVKVDVSRELNEHFKAVIKLRDDLINSPTAKDSDKVGGINACSSILKDLSKIQESLYGSELVAKLQISIVNTFDEINPELRTKFFNHLEGKLNG